MIATIQLDSVEVDTIIRQALRQRGYEVKGDISYTMTMQHGGTQREPTSTPVFKGISAVTAPVSTYNQQDR